MVLFGCFLGLNFSYFGSLLLQYRRRCGGIFIPRGRVFRLYIEEHYPFGDFALVRVRGDKAEVGFVLADEDVAKWPALYQEAWKIAEYFRRRIQEENLEKRAIPAVGKDLDFITVSVIVDLAELSDEEIYQLADQIMGILKETNPYRKEDQGNE